MRNTAIPRRGALGRVWGSRALLPSGGPPCHARGDTPHKFRAQLLPRYNSTPPPSAPHYLHTEGIQPMQLENHIRGSSGQERFLGSYGDSYQALWGLIVPWAGSKPGLSIQPPGTLQRVLLDRKSVTAECRSKIAPGAAQGKSDFSACMAIHTKPFGG